jgi:hypothetical protein
MLAVVVWTCECGCEVKVMYDTGGTTNIRCPNSDCKRTHPVDGKVSDLWLKDKDNAWREQDLAKFIVAGA